MDRSSGRDSGLRWLCPQCRQPDGPLRLAELPPELWITIFRHLDNLSMLEVRSTCHRWKDIVDLNLCLRQNFNIEFERNFTMDQRYYPGNLFPAPSASLRDAKIITVDAWWPSFGPGLTVLSLGGCEIALPTLLGMLKETANLTELILVGIKYTSVEEIKVDFRLEKLRDLSCESVFDVFIDIFPRLRYLNLTTMSEHEEDRACRLLQSVQSTLTELTCYFSPSMLERIASMSQLYPTHVFHLGEKKTVVQLCQIKMFQESIEDFCVTADNAALCEIGRNLRKLKSLRVDIESDETTFVPSFLAEMTRLSRLYLFGKPADNTQLVNFGRFRSPNLANLHLYFLRIVAGSLHSYLSQCPNIQAINMVNCVVDSWADIFAPRFASLRRLYLEQITATQNGASIPNLACNLQELRISKSGIPIQVLIQFILRCPQLEILNFYFMENITDELVLVLDRLPKLRKFSIYKGALTDISVDFIIEKCPRLVVDISGDQMISKTGNRRLKDFARFC
ncbi:uncharacterized protein LOC120415277 [Culex pipiens pallens]|uniref:uncharacterized protein LOC120415277 n=1 Tax=Culex pipiens pallens TaxID=42434 RepID=UPI001954FB18|nr:uncharacterized protein LOC120415277 [Culex pipiens pallens]